MINPQYYSQDLNVYSSHCLPYISYFCLEFNIFPELSRTSSLVTRLPSPSKCDNKIQDFPGKVSTLFKNSKWYCIYRLTFRSKQNCESLTYLSSHCDDRLFRTGKVQVTAKKSISKLRTEIIPKRRKLYRHRGVYKNSQSIKCANVTIPAKGPAYFRRVSCGYMSDDLPYILCCDWNFPPRVKHGEQLALM